MPASPLQHLRQAAWLARLVLAGLLLSLGVALASPIATPRAVEMICSGTGVMKLIVQTDDGAQEVVNTPVDCPMCQSFAAPPPVLTGWALPPQLLAHALTPVAAAHIAWVSRAPLPSRGPPAAV